MDNEIHVLPINDIQPHHESKSCPCNPVVEECDGGETLVIHNAFDGRDIEELKIKESG